MKAADVIRQRNYCLLVLARLAGLTDPPEDPAELDRFVMENQTPAEPTLETAYNRYASFLAGAAVAAHRSVCRGQTEPLLSYIHPLT